LKESASERFVSGHDFSCADKPFYCLSAREGSAFEFFTIPFDTNRETA
jgi:hypothetical protein